MDGSTLSFCNRWRFFLYGGLDSCHLRLGKLHFKSKIFRHWWSMQWLLQFSGICQILYLLLDPIPSCSIVQKKRHTGLIWVILFQLVSKNHHLKIIILPRFNCIFIKKSSIFCEILVGILFRRYNDFSNKVHFGSRTWGP